MGEETISELKLVLPINILMMVILELIKMRALEMMLTPLADSISLEDRLLRLALSYREWSVSPSLVLLAVTKAPLVSICKTSKL
jgi:hypothetical protein